MLREITIRYRIESSDVETFLATLIDREVEAAALKAIKKVLTKPAVEEMEKRGMKFPPFSIFFSKDGTVDRIGTSESSGDETAVEKKEEKKS
jgi:hypothetical protein